ncbi:hypothetical protein EX30DRAFT_341945 [Ascodesmis nigricans]|uniref:DUF7729 domain-containing protein n=1 Tax=Ascodesmis nigricans TaxID=341454 RepID=A0A4V3SIF1_9PEZI|nr:hypothetical protein EX30DRAFT_341945 [Ascodesmis nigricans]
MGMMKMEESSASLPRINTRARPCGLPINKGRRRVLITARDPPLASTRGRRGGASLLAPLHALLLVLSIICLLVPASAEHIQLLVERAAASESATATTITPSGSANSTSTGIATAQQTSGPVTLPRAFDGSGVTSNVTSECGLFMKSFLNTEEFKECYPLSMLILNSESYFTNLMKGAYAISIVLNKTCNPSPSVDKCTELMNRYAVALRSKDNCASDYAAQNPTVQQAYYGLVSYRTMYQAGCLKNGENFCYTQAVTNRDSPGDASPYFLPLGKSLADDADPTCSSCLQRTMEIFAEPASNRSQPISRTYSAAAIQINELCGVDFAKEVALPVSGSSSLVATSIGSSIVLALSVMLVASL